MCSQYQLSKLQEEENGREEVDDFQSGSPVVADPLNARCSSPLHSGYDAEKAELLRKVSRLREIAHLYNDEAEEWFSKYMKYKGHQETRITALLQRHFPLSNIAGYNLAQDKIIYVWDVQRRERAIKAEKERKKQLTKEAALPSRAHRSLKLY